MGSVSDRIKLGQIYKWVLFWIESSWAISTKWVMFRIKSIKLGQNLQMGFVSDRIKLGQIYKWVLFRIKSIKLGQNLQMGFVSDQIKLGQIYKMGYVSDQINQARPKSSNGFRFGSN
jgi:hypothetical protein